MPWPLYTTSARPATANNAGNTGLYANGSQSHSFGTRAWVSTSPSTSTPSAFTASFTQLGGLRKANWSPADFDSRDVTHLLSPYRVREKRASWGNPGSYEFEFNYTPVGYEYRASLTPSPAVVDDNHRYLIVEDPDGSVHQLYGFFHAPQKQADIGTNENVISQKFDSCGVDTFVRSGT
jgi:hypothetical protein